MANLRIGLDFDNTIACYDAVFLALAKEWGVVSADWIGGKSQIRDELRSRPRGERDWQRLQGQVYGRLMHRAQLFPEISNFLLRLKYRRDNVFIVSHKTEFGHNDPERVSLRKEAMRWMEHHRFFDSNWFDISVHDVFFADSREEKVARISELQCDVFIDDLWEVFAEPGFPAETKRILFGRNFDGTQEVEVDFFSRSWRNISRFLLGEERDVEVGNWVRSSLSVLPRSILKLGGRANSRVYRVECEEYSYALKWYPDLARDSRKRLLTEKQVCEFLHSQGIANVLQVVETAPLLNLALFRWIDGDTVADVKDHDVGQALQFVETLYGSRCSETASQLPEASEACLSIEDILNQIEQKRSRILGEENPPDELRAFFSSEFDLVYQEYLSVHEVEISELRRSGTLSASRQILSPSDFGFHNSLRQADGILLWLDFEYFGWDDPVKLSADFLWHPGHSLSASQRTAWLGGCLRIFSEDEQFASRLKTCFPLFGLRWSLIMLNVFCHGDEVEPDDRQRQLVKARHYVSLVSESLKTQSDVWNELQATH
tara:strand:- start:37 stop:1671 length:1635 start_codon:yes stop_codon:yes gene_type:complete